MSRMSIKRVNKELEYFFKRKYVDVIKNEYNFYDSIKMLTFLNKGLNNEDNLYVQIEKNNKFLIEYKVPNDYPFKCYQIVKHNFSNLEWNKYLNVLCQNVNKLENSKILYYFCIIQLGRYPLFLKNENKNSKCFCCASYNCPMNWAPNYKLNNCLEEYMEVEYINKYTKKHNNKVLISIYNNFLEFYKLPEELFEMIVNKVI